MSQARKLYRRPESGKIFGVAAGLAEYFDIDVTIVRIILIVLVIAGAGFVIPVYLVLALLLPTTEAAAKAGISSRSVQANFADLSREFTQQGGAGDYAKHYFGVGLIVIGAWLLLSRIFPEIFRITWDIFWPVMLILVGILLLSKLGGRRDG